MALGSLYKMRLQSGITPYRTHVQEATERYS